MDSQYTRIKKEREDTRLSLRKDTLSKSLMKSRLASMQQMNLNDTDYEIDISILNVNKEILDLFENAGIKDKVTIAYNEMNSNQMNHKMFGMKQMRNYTETLTDSIANANDNHSTNNTLITIEIFELIYDILTSEDNLNLIYEACCSMINITRYIPLYCNKLSENKYLSGIINILLNKHQSHIGIKSQVLMIVGNIIECKERSFIQKLLQEMPFFEYITNLFEDITSKERYLPMYAIAIVLWNIGSFVKYASDNDIETILPLVLKVYPLLVKIISNNVNKKIFTEGIICLRWIIDRMKSYPQIISLLNEYSVYPHLNSLITIDKPNMEITKMILIIYINISLVSDDAIKLIAEDNSLYSSIERMLFGYIEDSQTSKKKNDLIIIVYELLNNFAAMGQECNCIIRQTKIVEYTMKILEIHKSNRKLINEILLFLSNAIDTNDSRIKMELIRFSIIEFAVNELSYLECSITDIKQNCLKIIEIYLSYGNTLMKNRNIVKEQLELLNLHDVLSNLHNKIKNDNKGNIENAINNINNKYFNKEAQF